VDVVVGAMEGDIIGMVVIVDKLNFI